MARIRTIKPDFWTHEKVMSCKPLTRLLFIGMWNFADDYGRMAFAPLTIKARIFPNDDFSVGDIRDMLTELSSNGLVTIYSAKDKEFLEISGWEHQRIDRRQESKIPAPFDDGCRVFDEYSTSPPDNPRFPPTSAPVMEGNVREGKGEKETRVNALRSEFEIFWAQWPNKVGRPVAFKAFGSAMKRGADLAEILAGLARYVRDKPPDRPWLNPSTFLNQNRWEDAPAGGSTVVSISDKMPLEDAVAQFAKLGRWSRFAPVSDISQVPSEVLAKHGLLPDGRKMGTA